ncbi:MAG TPA: gas vesicle protein [Candidatus Avalokitesvara rifleensis]|uniref:gas vesicle protein n=1 Tax=Candidatus Avalokitesvara rifleensis TaxID=3367620 RepID=UPI00271370B8|nr:gas vesicle protein [Candidatus Brocadiales bacterium]
METRRTIQHSVVGQTLPEVLERILDKGIVITGDIKISLVKTELLTIQIRLLIASVDKAKEMGIDWWNHSGYPQQLLLEDQKKQIETLHRKLGDIESTHKEEFLSLKKELELVGAKKKKKR